MQRSLWSVLLDPFSAAAFLVYDSPLKNLITASFQRLFADHIQSTYDDNVSSCSSIGPINPWFPDSEDFL